VCGYRVLRARVDVKFRVDIDVAKFRLRLPDTFTSILKGVSRPSDAARPVQTADTQTTYQIKAYRAGYHTMTRIVKFSRPL